MQDDPVKRAKAKAAGYTDAEIDAFLARGNAAPAASSEPDEEEVYGVLPKVGRSIGQFAEGAEQFARGTGLGATQALTSAGRGLGYFVGGRTGRELEDWFKEKERGAEEFFDPQGRAGAAGQLVGRFAGEVGTAVTGGGAIAKGVSLAGRGLRTLSALRAGRLAAKAAPISQTRQIAQVTAAGMPIDVLQGLGQDEGLLFAKTREGAALENVLLSALGGGVAAGVAAGAPAVRRMFRGADDAKAARAAEILNETRKPITDPRRLLAPSSVQPPPSAAGPAIPMGPIRETVSEGPVPFERALVPYRQSAALPIGPEVQAARRDVERTIGKRRSSVQRRAGKRQAAVDLEEELASDPETAMQYMAERLGRGRQRARPGELSPEALMDLMRAAQRMKRTQR